MSLILGKTRTLIRWASLLLLSLLIATPLAQVVMRGVFNVPMSGTEELARYFLICLSFLAASFVTREGGQICMEEVQAFLPVVVETNEQGVFAGFTNEATFAANFNPSVVPFAIASKTLEPMFS